MLQLGHNINVTDARAD